MSNPTFPVTIPPEHVAALERIERDVTLELFDAAPPDFARDFGLSHRRIADGVWSVSRVLDHIMFCRVQGLGVQQPAKAAAVDEAIAAFDEAGVNNWIIQLAPGSDALAHLLAERGFEHHPRAWAKFVFEGLPPDPRTELALREIDRRHALDFGEVARSAFRMPPPTARWLAALVGRPGFRTFLAFDRDAPVACGSVYIAGNVSWLGFGATLPSHRGRGAQSAILAARIRASLDAGATMISTETGIPHAGEAGPSFKNIQRAGFRIAYARPNFRREAAALR
jgi:hypothetical protein